MHRNLPPHVRQYDSLDLLMYPENGGMVPPGGYAPRSNSIIVLRLKPRIVQRTLDHHMGKLDPSYGCSNPVPLEVSWDPSSTSMKLSGVREFIDYERIKQHLSTCTSSSSHRERCEPPKHKQSSPSKLIDCQMMTVVRAEPSYDYVALSYVWGRQEHDSSKGLHDSPATIRDAIKVTTKLGYRYLWIDRYCIDQSQSTEKHVEIQRMGRIYNGASLTIMAAAGSDPNHGLPGVSKARKNVAERRGSSNWTIVDIPDNLLNLIKSSIWQTRAWTYQEQILSRRRLYFTDQEAIFQCLNYSARESYASEEEAGLDPQSYALNPVRDYPLQIFGGISEYSRRELTYSHDYLNGLSGILEHLAEEEDSAFHLFGVPILPPEYVTDENKIITRDYPALLMIGMTWKISEGQRRLDLNFPSWSWVGWSGHVDWDYDILYELSSSNEVWVEDEMKKPWPLRDLCKQQHVSIRNFNFAQAIHIEADTFEVVFDDDDYATWKSQDGRSVYTEAELIEGLSTHLAQGDIPEARRFKALVLGIHEYEEEEIEDEEGDEYNLTSIRTWVCKLLRQSPEGHEVVGHMSFRLYDIIDTSGGGCNELLLPCMVKERVRLV
ncbi:heterokaryon incompatibility protein-domain-containing protein [Daldinia vernicosa]|uniref:heterokaryon incompatibility protein-domain-containing protein n=1 Tax=Daldinia vernicosa TaxID=114800 RepID=UPI0020089775|nr:heterokaryon incompatibility protein-domain-containing protein [Daldinia vernicosa]KAI0854455.1 heterokaryon incompatibility protein-domain-containing protein [Daldinia vernicosa]